MRTRLLYALASHQRSLLNPTHRGQLLWTRCTTRPTWKPCAFVRSIPCSATFKREATSTRNPSSREVKASPETPDSLRPETIQRPDHARASQHEEAAGQTAPSAPKTDSLLSEQTVSNKEQRKADWAIIREMSTYLWPKVGAGNAVQGHFMLLSICRMISEHGHE